MYIYKGFESSLPPKVPATLDPSKLGMDGSNSGTVLTFGERNLDIPGYVCLTRVDVISPRLLDLSHPDSATTNTLSTTFPGRWRKCGPLSKA